MCRNALLGGLEMPLFFLLSGYGLTLSYGKYDVFTYVT
jgi:hypothetical protein